jgi:dTMP kinase
MWKDQPGCSTGRVSHHPGDSGSTLPPCPGNARTRGNADRRRSTDNFDEFDEHGYAPADRNSVVPVLTRPALLRGEIVICDRYGDSTLAYQGYGHRIELAKLRQLIDFATGGLKPDLTLLLDLDTETGLKRRLKDGGWNRLDAYDLEFHRRVRQGYLEMAAQESGRWVVIDASPSFVEVQETLRKVVLGYLINHD